MAGNHKKDETGGVNLALLAILAILVMLGAYLMIPKYEFITMGKGGIFRCNKRTGEVHVSAWTGGWEKVPEKKKSSQ